MEFTLVHPIILVFSIHSGIGSDVGLYRDTTGAIVFSVIFVNISLFLLYFSSGKMVYVRLFPFREVFALVHVRFDGRKPTAGYFKLHRLLYFIRAVLCPPPEAAAVSPTGRVWGKSCTVDAPPEINPVMRITFVCENRFNPDLRLPVQSNAANRKNVRTVGKALLTGNNKNIRNCCFKFYTAISPVDSVKPDQDSGANDRQSFVLIGQLTSLSNS